MRIQIIFVLLLFTFSGNAQAQKGTKSIAAGPLVSFPTGLYRSDFSLKPGVGVEAIGQYHFSNRSSVLLQTSLASFPGRNPYRGYIKQRLSLFSLSGGYQYQLSNTGFFTNALVGIDYDNYTRYSGMVLRLGAGKRILLKDAYFIDAGVDYIFLDTYSRLNLKAVVSIFQRQ